MINDNTKILTWTAHISLHVIAKLSDNTHLSIGFFFCCCCFYRPLVLQMAITAAPKAAVRGSWMDGAPLQRSAVLQQVLVMVYPAVRRTPASVWLQRVEFRHPPVSMFSILSRVLLKAWIGGHEDQQPLLNVHLENNKKTISTACQSVW